MEIKIKSCLNGAKEAYGIAVIIDVFRASNTIIACLAQGAEYIIPVAGLEEAKAIKIKKTDNLLFGERKGLIPEGFEYGNSPAKALNLSLKNKKIILTTSAGSQGIVNAKNAQEILIGSFANAQTLANYLQFQKPEIITLVPMGLEANQKAEEDEECANFLKNLILDERQENFSEIRKRVLTCSGADRLRRLNQEDDLEFCLKPNTFNIIPKFFPNLNQIKKI